MKMIGTMFNNIDKCESHPLGRLNPHLLIVLGVGEGKLHGGGGGRGGPSRSGSSGSGTQINMPSQQPALVCSVPAQPSDAGR